MSVSDRPTGDTLLLDAALQSIPYGFCVWSPQFELQLWNKSYLELYGLAESAIYLGQRRLQGPLLVAVFLAHESQSRLVH